MPIEPFYHERIKSIRQDATLSQIDRLLYVFLLNLCIEQEDQYHYSIRTIFAKTGIATASVHKGINNLEAAGYIQTERKRKGGKGHELLTISIPGLDNQLKYPPQHLHFGLYHMTIYLVEEGGGDGKAHPPSLPL